VGVPLFGFVEPTLIERQTAVAGDDLVPRADVTMDRAFWVAATPEQVWPWVLQLGKARAGWYLPRWFEWVVPPSRRGIRRIEPRWQELAVGDVIPDYGPDGSFTVAAIDPPRSLIYTSERGRVRMSWAFALSPEAGGTRIHLRLRLTPVRHVGRAETVGGLFDLITIAGMAAGLRERLAAAA
jgi:hypothetical protein